MTEIVRLNSSDLRCPHCRRFRAELVITAEGDLRCAGCPAAERYRRQSKRKERVA